MLPLNMEALCDYCVYILYLHRVCHYFHTFFHLKVHRFCKYRIAQIYGTGELWWLWRITGGSPNFTIHILTMSLMYIMKANKQEFAKVLLAKFLIRNSSRFSSAKILRYIVYGQCTIIFYPCCCSIVLKLLLMF